MFKYSLKRLADNQILASMNLAEDIENPWASKFEKFDIYAYMHNARDAVIVDGIEVQPARSKNYEVIKENITAEIQQEEYLKQVKYKRAFCNDLIDKISLRNAMRGITEAQTLQIIQTYSDIYKLLQAGAAGTAKELLSSIEPSELIPEADLDFVIGELNKII